MTGTCVHFRFGDAWMWEFLIMTLAKCVMLSKFLLHDHVRHGGFAH